MSQHRKSAKKLVVGNWKMNPKSLRKAQEIFSSIDRGVAKLAPRGVQAVVCPPAAFLAEFSPKKLLLGAQDIFYEPEGAYTGEISGAMLSDLNVSHVIIGHSEQRALGETNVVIARKIKAALAFGLTPILCVGEAVRDETGIYLSFLKEEIKFSLSSVPKSAIPKIVVAYEPLWAIGKNAVREATPEECEEMSIFIRKTLSDLCRPMHKNIRILYGGSVTANNASDFLSRGGVDGLLVGRESLDPKKFLEIIRIADNIR